MKLKRSYVYDLTLRLCHASLAFFCLALLLTAWGAEYFGEDGMLRKAFWILHIFSGYGLLFSLMARVIWGVIGPSHSKWSDFWKWLEWKQILKSRSLNFKWGWGHHPLAAISYLFFYVTLGLMGLTGIVLSAIEHNAGPLAPQLYDEVLWKGNLSLIHEVLSWAVLIFILTHLGALVWHEKRDKIPIAQSMVSGYQYRSEDKEESP